MNKRETYLADGCSWGTEVYEIYQYEPDMPVLDIREVIELERQAAERGTSLLTLMRRAGDAVFQVANDIIFKEGSSKGKVIVFAGSGNNGGDGWVAASKLADNGYDVILVSKALPDEISTEPAKSAAKEAVCSNSFQIAISPNVEKIDVLLKDANLIIDAMLGTGFAHSEVRMPYADWIACANAARVNRGIPILSVDCPSGLNAQTGQAAKSCIRADETITMIAAKTGLIQADSKEYVGMLLVAPIGVEIQRSAP